MVDEIDRGVVVHVLHAEHLLDPLHPLLGRHHLALSLVDLVVELVLEPCWRSWRTR